MTRLAFITWARGKGLDVTLSDVSDRMFVDDQTELCYRVTQEVRFEGDLPPKDYDLDVELPTSTFAVADLLESVRRFDNSKDREEAFRKILRRYAAQSVAAQPPEQEPEREPLFLGTWHHGQGNLCCGTMRYLRADFDTQPAPEIRVAIFDWICSTMNAATDRWRKQRRARENADAPLAPMVRPALQRFATPADASLSPSDFIVPRGPGGKPMTRAELIFSLSDLAPLAQHARDAVGLRFGDDTIDDPRFHKGGVVTRDDHGGTDISNLDNDKLGPALILRRDLALMSSGLPVYKLPDSEWQHVVFPKVTNGHHALRTTMTCVGMPEAVLDALALGMTELVVDLAKKDWSFR